MTCDCVKLAISCQHRSPSPMTTMNISLPVALKAFVDEQVADGGYCSCSAYIRALIRHDQDSRVLRAALLEGFQTPLADAAYFDSLREDIRRRATGS